MITNVLQIKDLLLLNAIMDFACIMASALRLIYRKQSIVTNSLQINKMRLPNSIMDFHYSKLAADQGLVDAQY
jgi:hypothetical protein